MPTIDAVGYDTNTGGVLLTVSNVAAGQRVARVRRNGKVALLHQVDLPAGRQTVADWMAPLGEDATYVILPNSAAAPGTALATRVAAIPGGTAWLRRANDPNICSKMRVMDTGTEGEEVRATIFDISGRRAPLVVYNSRSARRGTLTFMTTNRDERNLLEYIFADGSPLIFNMCISKAFQPLNMVAADVRWTRIDKKPTWFTVEVDYIEVEDGEWIGESADYLPPVFNQTTYDAIKTLTYQEVYDQYLRYTNIATGYKP